MLDIWWFYELFFQCTFLGNHENFEWWLVRKCIVFVAFIVVCRWCCCCCCCRFCSFVFWFVCVCFFFFCVDFFSARCLFPVPFVCQFFVQAQSCRSALNLVYSVAGWKMSQIIKRIDQHQIHWYYVYFDVYNTDAVCSKFFYVLCFFRFVSL